MRSRMPPSVCTPITPTSSRSNSSAPANTPAADSAGHVRIHCAPVALAEIPQPLQARFDHFDSEFVTQHPRATKNGCVAFECVKVRSRKPPPSAPAPTLLPAPGAFGKAVLEPANRPGSSSVTVFIKKRSVLLAEPSARTLPPLAPRPPPRPLPPRPPPRPPAGAT